MNAKQIKQYLVKNYGECKQDENLIATALNNTAKEYELNAKELFHMIVENKPINAFTHSYGFQTRYGREIINYFKKIFYIYYTLNK